MPKLTVFVLLIEFSYRFPTTTIAKGNESLYNMYSKSHNVIKYFKVWNKWNKNWLGLEWKMEEKKNFVRNFTLLWFYYCIRSNITRLYSIKKTLLAFGKSKQSLTCVYSPRCISLKEKFWFPLAILSLKITFLFSTEFFFSLFLSTKWNIPHSNESGTRYLSIERIIISGL